MTPEERQRIVDDVMSKSGLSKPDPALDLANRLREIDHKVLVLITEEFKTHGFVRNKEQLAHKIGAAYFEELKAFHEGELRSITATLLAVRATELL